MLENECGASGDCFARYETSGYGSMYVKRPDKDGRSPCPLCGKMVKIREGFPNALWNQIPRHNRKED